MYVLHHSPDSAALIVRLVLEELGLPYRVRPIDRAGGELASPAYRAMQPLGLIPVLETPDGLMFETGAILLYLCEKHGALAPAPGTPGRARYLTWFIFTNHNLHPALLQLFYPERIAGPAAADATVTHARDRLVGALGHIDAMIAAEAPAWLSPDAPSALGYYLGVLARWLGTFGPDHPAYIDRAHLTHLLPVLAALESRPAARRAAEAEALGQTIFTAPDY